MPYIKANIRDTALYDPLTPGELNFAITCILQHYIGTRPLSYSLINDCLGALEGAKMEFYRRLVVPYEEEKKRLHGDVY